MHQAPSRLLCAAAALALMSVPALADNGVSPVLVVNPVSLNPATPNPVTIVNPGGAPSAVTVNGTVTVQNRDEPGRNPYQESTGTACTTVPPVCIASFPVVPAGHRLVVTFVSAFIQPSLTGIRGALAIEGLSGDVAVFPFTSTIGSASAAQPMTFYFEAGQVPQVKFEGPPLDVPAITGALASMTGYLVEVP
jgi:hypothetical protein